MVKENKPLHIGFIFYDFSDSRAIEVINGIVKNLKYDKLSFFPTGPLNSKKELDDNNRIKVLDALISTPLDGLISLQFWEIILRVVWRYTLP